MDTNLQQSQKLEHGLSLTPAQQRSLEILQKPVIELQKFLEEQLAQNPMLEIEEFQQQQKPQSIGENPDDIDDYDDNSDTSELSQSDTDNFQQKHDFILNSEPDSIHLGEKLINEARIDAPTKSVADAFESLVEQLDSRGFLPVEAIDVSIEQGFKRDDVLKALEMLQTCAPYGIGARSLQECFLNQLRANGLSESLAYRIIEDYFQLFIKRKVNDIAQAEGRSIDAVEKALETIAKLNSSPAHEYTVNEENILIPDINYYKQDGIWCAELTNNYIPQLRINSEYRFMIAEGSLNKDALSYLKEKMRDAKNIIDAIKQRQTTLLKIANAILKRQQNYFENAILQPMTRQQIADDIQLHPTTIGRAISGKNAQTPFGVIELKNFFTNSLETEQGNEVSSNTIKEKISDIVSNENPQKPLSDDKIAKMLETEGITIARRTVAKYRDELGIPSKTMRKRF